MKKIAFLTALLIMLTGMCLVESANYPLFAAGESKRITAVVTPPDGFTCAPEMAVFSETPEYYFVPADEESPVRFIYYTTGNGDPRALAEAAMTDYGAFYDEFHKGEVREVTICGRACLCFDYTCAYPDRKGDGTVYEQTVVAYVPLESDAFIACIVSLDFDGAGSYVSKAALTEQLEVALDAIAMVE